MEEMAGVGCGKVTRLFPMTTTLNSVNPPIYLNWNFPILQFKIASLMNWIFFPSLKPTGYFFQIKLIFFQVSWLGLNILMDLAFK